MQIEPAMAGSGFNPGKPSLPSQSGLTAFGASNEFVGQAPSTNRLPSAIGPNTTGGSNISSPAGVGILPPQSGMSDVVGIASVLGSTGNGGVGAIGGSSNNPGSQFLGGGGFSSAISQLTGNTNSNSFGLGGQTSSSGRFGTTQSGFSDSLSQGYFPVIYSQPYRLILCLLQLDSRNWGINLCPSRLATSVISS